MAFLCNSHLSLSTSHIETPRCILVPFSLDIWVDIHEFHEEFCHANADLYVSPHLPTYDEEVAFLEGSIEKIRSWEEFENFILERETNRLIGAWWLRILESGELNIGIWIRVSEHGKGYASEVYTALIKWARENTSSTFLKHSVHPTNTASMKLAEKFGGVLQEGKTERGHLIYHIPL